MFVGSCHNIGFFRILQPHGTPHACHNMVCGNFKKVHIKFQRSSYQGAKKFKSGSLFPLWCFKVTFLYAKSLDWLPFSTVFTNYIFAKKIIFRFLENDFQNTNFSLRSSVATHRDLQNELSYAPLPQCIWAGSQSEQIGSPCSFCCWSSSVL